MTFEQSMKRLEEIIAKMEKNELSLEETMKLYEEACEISDKCKNELESAQIKIKTLSGGDGENE